MSASEYKALGMYVAKLKEMGAALGRRKKLVALLSGGDGRAIQSYINTPGKGATIPAKMRETIDNEYDNLRPFPLPDDLRIAWKTLNRLKTNRGSRELSDFLIMLEGFLLRMKPSISEAASFMYMRGMVNFSKGFSPWQEGDVVWWQSKLEGLRATS